MADIRRTQITDKRTVTITVVDAPEHRTPGGATPIEPFAVEIRMWVSPRGGDLETTLEIRGRRLEGTRVGQTVTRRFYGDSMVHAPKWAVALAEQHRPAWAPTREGSVSD